MNIQLKKITFTSFFKASTRLSFLLILISILILFFKGLNLGVDFKGGTLIELRIDSNQIDIQEVRNSFSRSDLANISVKEFGKKGDFLVKLDNQNMNDKDFIQKLNSYVSNKLAVDVNFRRVENVGPKVSKELINAAIIAISLSLSAMLIYIWIRFEWQFSVAAILALIHDVILTLGIFSFLNLEVNLSIIAAILTIVGYSMNDTVVIFDRIRENLKKYDNFKIDQISDISINATLSRTLITSITTLLALIAIFLFGGEVLKGFSFALIFGVIIGTYSSIFIATPVLNFTNVNQKSVVKEKS
tara:strand:+ start:884 stop:1789 length:906 start_codon:yes stop_codon:yes gene_type:complete